VGAAIGDYNRAFESRFNEKFPFAATLKLSSRIALVTGRGLRQRTSRTPLTMIRKAFVMSVHPGKEVEYEHRHRPIWERLERVLKAHGVHNYSIFLHPETRQLFGYVEIEDESRWAAIARTPECQEWWRYMADLMPSNPDASPVSRELREVFHID
jgi:L-rhamnose mutarotase